ncbi:MAG TPA: hypothetical protein VFZ64_04985 [Nocardioidaceae bacterium]
MRRVRRTGLVLAASGLGLGLLAGCADEGERYCDDLADSRERLSDLAGSTAEDPGALEETLAVLEDLGEGAPGDVADEWTTLVFAYEGLVEAFDDAGVSPADYDPGAPPEDVTEEEARRIEDAAAELASARVLAAADGVEQHARDVCKVDLGLAR